MKKSTAKTIKALVSLGLNTYTGTSPMISMGDIEKKSKLRQVSNGAKIIREDQYPFSCFKITRTYDDTNNLVAVKFNGYRDVAYETNVIAATIQKKKEKAETLKAQIKEAEEELMKLVECEATNKIYCEQDILTFVKFCS